MADDDLWGKFQALYDNDSMTHAAPTPAEPYMHPNVPIAVDTLRKFAHGGLVEAAGKDPGPMGFLSSDAANAALGAVNPMAGEGSWLQTLLGDIKPASAKEMAYWSNVSAKQTTDKLTTQYLMLGAKHGGTLEDVQKHFYDDVLAGGHPNLTGDQVTDILTKIAGSKMPGLKGVAYTALDEAPSWAQPDVVNGYLKAARGKGTNAADNYWSDVPNSEQDAHPAHFERAIEWLKRQGDPSVKTGTGKEPGLPEGFKFNLDLPDANLDYRDKFNTFGFHGTPRTAGGKEFDELLNPNEEIGLHFGTNNAAHDIMMGMNVEGRHLDKYSGDRFENMKRIYPLMAQTRNPLEMRDLGSWGPDNIGRELERLGWDKAEVRAAKTAAPASDPAARIQSLRKYIESKGYDSIKYVNQAEDPGSMSYITWKPVRSPWAMFDPANADSRKLMAGVAGASLLPAGLLSGRNDGQ